MEEDENVSVSMVNNEVKSCNRNRLVLSLHSFNVLGIGGILQGLATKTIAFIAIASSTISATIAASQFSGNDLDAIVASDDYVFDIADKRIYRNLSINTPIVKSVSANISDSDNSENVTMASLGNNLLVAAVTSTFNAIKSNDSVIQSPSNISSITEIDVESTPTPMIEDQNNYWALSALFLVVGTAAGNILVCLAIAWERRLQNVTNYFLMSLAITDLMVAVLVMPLGILTLVKGEYYSHLDVFLALYFACMFLVCFDEGSALAKNSSNDHQFNNSHTSNALFFITRKIHTYKLQ